MNNPGRAREPRRQGDNPDPDDDSPPWWAIGLGVAAGVAVVAGGIYMLSQLELEQPQSQSNDKKLLEIEPSKHDISEDTITDTVSLSELSSTPKVSNLNSLLEDIHKRYIAIKKEDFECHYDVFNNVFYQLHQHMKSVDAYYQRYSSRVQFMGSHYDRLRIKKSNEFDLDIIIGLPVNIHEDKLNPEESDIVIEPKHPGYVQLRAGKQYLKILEREDIDINRRAYLWLDERHYIQRSKFVSWFQGVVDRALNKFDHCGGYPCMWIDGTLYKIAVSSSGPAYTLKITSYDFSLDVDLVPTLKFPEARWLGRNTSYRDIPPGCSADFWIVVPKPNKFGANKYDEDRSWRVAMHDQERKLIHNSFHLRQVNRLLKKLRDTQQLDYIKSYYIKTLFLWKMSELNDPSFWQRDVATIFKVMLREFHDVLVVKNISFFWNKKQNMIERVPEHILKGYANKLKMLITKLEDDSNYMCAAQYLLTGSEYTEYTITRFLGSI